MTAITPLEFIHKKGSFGDHHKKNETDLLQISEVINRGKEKALIKAEKNLKMIREIVGLL